MQTLLCHIAVQDGRVKRSSLEVLTRSRALARAHGLTLNAVVLAPEPADYVDEIRQYGPERIYTVQHPIFEQHLNAPVVAALARVIAHARADLVVFASSEAVKDVLGALAVEVNAAVLPDVAAFDLAGGRVEARRPVMAAKFMEEAVAEGDRVLVSVRSGSYAAEEAPADSAVEEVPFDFDPDGLRQTLRDVIKAIGNGAVDLSEARIVVGVGRGVRDEEGKRLVQELADVLGAAIGASRAVVEAGLFPATAQVGQTGKVVSPDLYFAIGISGAIQHVAGMVNSRVIVAINKDADAPIFKYATYGIAEDLYKVLPPLIEELRKARA